MSTPHDAPSPPSERSFGVVVGGVLIVIAGVRLGIRAFDGLGRDGDGLGAPHHAWLPGVDVVSAGLIAVGGVLNLLAAVQPAWLRIPNRLWFKFGLLLSRIVNPVILFLIYAVCVVPIGVVMRFFGHDPLRLKRDPEAQSHWRAPEPSPLEEPMRQQF